MFRKTIFFVKLVQGNKHSSWHWNSVYLPLLEIVCNLIALFLDDVHHDLVCMWVLQMW